MAITINGSGTISGISAGGLPDGVVTADDLASTLDLSGKTVTLAAGGTGYGKVLQVVSATSTSSRSTSSASLVSSGFSASITPSSATSKVYVIFSGRFYIDTGSQEARIVIYRGATAIQGGYTLYNSDPIAAYQTMVVLDSPATTSSTTYTIYFSVTGGTSASLNPNGAIDGAHSLTLMEIAA